MADTDLRLTDGDHAVHIYDDADDLDDVVGGYLKGALDDGAVIVVIAMPIHAERFRAALAAGGADLAAAEAAQRVAFFDAADMLSRFMLGGVPDPAAFDSSVGQLVRDAASGGRPVCAYGEMVAALWDDGNVTGALALEELWNDFQRQLGFSLLCAYHVEAVADVAEAEAFSAMCHLHSDVVAGAPNPTDVESARRFPKTVRTPSLARAFVADALRDWDRADLVGDAALVVGELTTNAILHAQSDVTVGVSRQGDWVTVHVGDSSSTAPEIAPPRPDGAGGHGLRLVDRIARRWGWAPLGRGKVVWVELAGAVIGAADQGAV